MTTIELPAVQVTAPPVVPYPFGLFSVPFTPAPQGTEWINGAWFRSLACNAVGTTLAPCTVDAVAEGIEAGDLLATVANCSVRKAYAFTVFAAVQGSAGSGALPEQAAGAKALLLAGEQYAAEAYLWAALDAEAALGESTAAADYVGVLAQAEQAIADNYGGSPVLHMSRATATRSWEVIQRDGNRLASLLGSPVIAGGGYGASATEHKIIATGGLVVMRSDVYDFAQVIDRATNTVAQTVCRDYLIGWDCATVLAELAS